MDPLHIPVEQPTQKMPPAPSEEMWDTYLAVLKSQDLCQLCELLTPTRDRICSTFR
jgi:hypothetical protein